VRRRSVRHRIALTGVELRRRPEGNAEGE